MGFVFPSTDEIKNIFFIFPWVSFPLDNTYPSLRPEHKRIFVKPQTHYHCPLCLLINSNANPLSCSRPGLPSYGPESNFLQKKSAFSESTLLFASSGIEHDYLGAESLLAEFFSQISHHLNENIGPHCLETR